MVNIPSLAEVGMFLWRDQGTNSVTELHHPSIVPIEAISQKRTLVKLSGFISDFHGSGFM